MQYFDNRAWSQMFLSESLILTLFQDCITGHNLCKSFAVYMQNHCLLTPGFGREVSPLCRLVPGTGSEVSEYNFM